MVELSLNLAKNNYENVSNLAKKGFRSKNSVVNEILDIYFNNLLINPGETNGRRS